MGSRTALITGVLGQDGTLLAELLLARGDRVVGVARPGAQPPPSLPGGVELTQVALTDPVQVREMIERWQPDELYHLAAFHHSSQESSISAALDGKGAMLSTNFSTTQVLAFALMQLEAACHLVFASSSQIFTPTRMEDRVDELHERRPASFYGCTKSWSMELLAFLRQESKLRASSAILFNHESPLRGRQFVSRKITEAAAAAARGGRPALRLQNIGARVDWSSARDVVAALALIAASERPSDYIVASGRLRSVREFLKAAFSSVDVDWAEFTTFDSDSASPALAGEPLKLETELGWRRRSTFEDMVREMVLSEGHPQQGSTA